VKGNEPLNKVRPIHYRALTPDDHVIFAYLRRSALTGEPDAFGATWAIESQRSVDEWRSFIASRTIFAAFEGDDAVGIAAGGDRDARPLARGLYSMWVDPRVRGTGVSVALISLVEDWARLDGAQTVALDVVAHLEHPRALYRRCGFVETGRHSVLHRDTSITLLEMEKTL
jgi:GNAT superfamily N-acetyltransferase